ncbi:hypothetical protein [Candidatus Nesciobacter abundans]|uniref:Uncharacterized protein n=1 Tax=Candidatus Nesciobacter abundans TaxID=2601668 RepID=A0A5C0UJR8_9PROT|nr:hypothetical protein [Candidatus Nesciobacter abundans]QEK39054.1 hypothetical protein FZC36_01215 [Candidatus Nesciobacter abundans]
MKRILLIEIEELTVKGFLLDLQNKSILLEEKTDKSDFRNKKIQNKSSINIPHIMKDLEFVSNLERNNYIKFLKEITVLESCIRYLLKNLSDRVESLPESSVILMNGYIYSHDFLIKQNGKEEHKHKNDYIKRSMKNKMLSKNSFIFLIKSIKQKESTQKIRKFKCFCFSNEYKKYLEKILNMEGFDNLSIIPVSFLKFKDSTKDTIFNEFCFVNIYYEKTFLYFVENKEIVSIKVLDIGYELLDKNISKELSISIDSAINIRKKNKSIKFSKTNLEKYIKIKTQDYMDISVSKEDLRNKTIKSIGHIYDFIERFILDLKYNGTIFVKDEFSNEIKGIDSFLKERSFFCNLSSNKIKLHHIYFLINKMHEEYKKTRIMHKLRNWVNFRLKKIYDIIKIR